MGVPLLHKVYMVGVMASIALAVTFAVGRQDEGSAVGSELGVSWSFHMCVLLLHGVITYHCFLIRDHQPLKAHGFVYCSMSAVAGMCLNLVLGLGQSYDFSGLAPHGLPCTGLHVLMLLCYPTLSIPHLLRAYRLHKVFQNGEEPKAAERAGEGGDERESCLLDPIGVHRAMPRGNHNDQGGKAMMIRKASDLLSPSMIISPSMTAHSSLAMRESLLAGEHSRQHTPAGERSASYKLLAQQRTPSRLDMVGAEQLSLSQRFTPCQTASSLLSDFNSAASDASDGDMYGYGRRERGGLDSSWASQDTFNENKTDTTGAFSALDEADALERSFPVAASFAKIEAFNEQRMLKYHLGLSAGVMVVGICSFYLTMPIVPGLNSCLETQERNSAFAYVGVWVWLLMESVLFLWAACKVWHVWPEFNARAEFCVLAGTNTLMVASALVARYVFHVSSEDDIYPLLMFKVCVYFAVCMLWPLLRATHWTENQSVLLTVRDVTTMRGILGHGDAFDAFRKHLVGLQDNVGLTIVDFYVETSLFRDLDETSNEALDMAWMIYDSFVDPQSPGCVVEILPEHSMRGIIETMGSPVLDFTNASKYYSNTGVTDADAEPMYEIPGDMSDDLASNKRRSVSSTHSTQSTSRCRDPRPTILLTRDLFDAGRVAAVNILQEMYYDGGDFQQTSSFGSLKREAMSTFRIRTAFEKSGMIHGRKI